MRLFVNSITQTQTDPDFPENGVRVFLVNGQSNAVGYAENVDVPINELDPFTYFKIWNNSNAWANLQIGVNNRATSLNDHGIELGLAVNIRSYFPDDEFYIVKDGKGGEDALYFMPNGNENRLYYNTRKALRTALNNLIDSGKQPYLYILWHQGENDASTNQVNTYREKIDELFNLFEQNYAIDVPIIMMELLGNNANRLLIGDIFRDVEADNTNRFLTESKDLDSRDSSHFNYQGFMDMSIMHLDNTQQQTIKAYTKGRIQSEMFFYTTSVLNPFTPTVNNTGAINWLLIQDSQDGLTSASSSPTFNLSGNTDRGCLIAIQSSNTDLSNVTGVNLSNKSITSYDIREAKYLSSIDLSNNLLIDFYLDDLLSKLAATSVSNGSLLINGNTGSLTIGSQSNYDILIGRGWTIDAARP